MWRFRLEPAPSLLQSDLVTSALLQSPCASARIVEDVLCLMSQTVAPPHLTPRTSTLPRLKLRFAAIFAEEVRFDSGSAPSTRPTASNYRQVPIGVVIPVNKKTFLHRRPLPRPSRSAAARGGGTSLAGNAVTPPSS